MKIKLAYPKIPDTLNCPLKQCVAFEKIDGTCIALYWSPEDDFHSFGTRRDKFPSDIEGIRQFNSAHPELTGLEGATNRLLYPFPMSYFLRTTPPYSQAKEVILFAEYHGPNSFAGSHKKDDQKDLILFDVQVDGRILSPDQFLQFAEASGTDSLYLPKVVFQGKFSGQLFVDVRKGKYDVKEGVVVKGLVDGQVYMAKIKTEKYLEQLKEKFGDKWKEYGE